MAFPVIASITATSFGTDATAHLVAMPATVDANDLLIIIFGNDGAASVTTPANWNLIASNPNGTACRLSTYYKIAVGNEDGTTVDVVTAATEKAAAQVYRITAASWHGTTPPETAAAVTGATANPDPPATTPSWGSADTMWLAVYGADDDDDASAYPTNYTNGTYTQSDNSTTAASIGTARRELAAASDNPGTFTIAASEEWVSQTIAIRPAGTVTLTGVLFAKAPTFFTGAITTGAVTVSGALFTKAPSFFTGAITQAFSLSGVLFAQAPTFFVGAITTGPVTLSGALFSKAPSFFAGSVTTTYQLAGILFTKAPSFSVGAVTTTYQLAGSLFTNAPAFFVGSVSTQNQLAGVLFTNTPSFFVGAISTSYQLGGVLFVKAPVFPTGVISQATGSQTLTGILFGIAPGFFAGVVSLSTVTTPPFGASITNAGRSARISDHDRSLVVR
jgi:hypothetical protein